MASPHCGVCDPMNEAEVPTPRNNMTEVQTNEASAPMDEEITSAVSIRQLLESGVHFGHRTERWNPRMKPFIFGERNKTHILDLQQTTV